MNYSMLMMAVFLCLSFLTSAITLDNGAVIQKSISNYVDGVQIKDINVTLLPPDGIIYNITAASSSSVLSARLIGVIAFANLTIYHPEVTHGWIGIFLDEPAFFDIYPSDLAQIEDRGHASQSEALKVVNNIINTRGTSSSISKRPAVSTKSSSNILSSTSSPTTRKSTTSYSSHSSDCEPVYVKGHYRSGHWVSAHYRKKPGCD